MHCVKVKICFKKMKITIADQYNHDFCYISVDFSDCSLKASNTGCEIQTNGGNGGSTALSCQTEYKGSMNM